MPYFVESYENVYATTNGSPNILWEIMIRFSRRKKIVNGINFGLCNSLSRPLPCGWQPLKYERKIRKNFFFFSFLFSSFRGCLTDGRKFENSWSWAQEEVYIKATCRFTWKLRKVEVVIDGKFDLRPLMLQKWVKGRLYKLSAHLLKVSPCSAKYFWFLPRWELQDMNSPICELFNILYFLELFWKCSLCLNSIGASCVLNTMSQRLMNMRVCPSTRWQPWQYVDDCHISY